MKTYKKIILMMLFGSISIIHTNCKKETAVNQNINEKSNVVNNDFELKNSDFYIVEATVPKDGMVIVSSEDGNTVYSKSITKNRQFSQRISTPKSTEKIKVKYGEQVILLKLTTEKVYCSFYPDIRNAKTDADLDEVNDDGEKVDFSERQNFSNEELNNFCVNT